MDPLVHNLFLIQKLLRYWVCKMTDEEKIAEYEELLLLERQAIKKLIENLIKKKQSQFREKT